MLQGANSTGRLIRRSARSSNISLSLINSVPDLQNRHFMAVLDAFVYVAPKTNEELTRTFGVIPVRYNMALRMRPISFREDPPFFEYRKAALGSATVPSDLLCERHEEWTETTLNCRVNGTLVGGGEIVRD